MSGSPKQVERPTLPGIQDLFPDREFERLRVEDSPAIPKSAPPLFGSGIMPTQSSCVLGACDMKHASSQHPRSELSIRDARQEQPTGSRSSHSPTISPASRAGRQHTRAAPYPERRPSPPTAGEAFMNHIQPSSYRHGPNTGKSPSATLLPTYVLSADECPPDDDRRHGCGICHRRFNRPSSLMIHMNSHTGAQPFECPFPGCTRRFSVNSNMRRHYRNHREAAGPSAQIQPYPPAYYRHQDAPHAYYSASMSSPSSSSQSSFADSDDRDRADVAVAVRGLADEHRGPLHPSSAPALSLSQGRARADSDAYPPKQARPLPVSRPRACTVPGCNCNEAPSALRPAAFQQGSSRFSPRHR